MRLSPRRKDGEESQSKEQSNLVPRYLTDQMNFGGQEYVLPPWMEGLDSVIVNPLDPGSLVHQQQSLGYGHNEQSNQCSGSQSSFANTISSSQQFETHPDSGYYDSGVGATLSPDLFSSPSFNHHQPWLDDSQGLLGGSYPSEKSSGFLKNQSYPTLQTYADHQQQKQQWKSDDAGEFSGGVLSCKGSSEKLSRSGSTGSVSSGGSLGMVASQGRVPSPLGNGSGLNLNLKLAAGDKYFPSTPAAVHQQQQQQEAVKISGLDWNIQPNQTALQEQDQQQQQQQQRGAVFGSEAEDSGIRLVHLLVACAQAIQRSDRASAEETVRKINQAVTVASQQQQTGPMTRVAAHLAEALTRRIYGISSSCREALLSANGVKHDPLPELLHFYEICPYLKFAHFTANQSILEAFRGAKHVHVIDLHLNHGLQWPALIQALALRQGGPPSLRLTGISPPQLAGDDSLQEIGMNLSRLAKSVNVPFQFRRFTASRLDEIKPWMLQVHPGEVVAVNSMFQLHRLLYSDGTRGPGIDEVLQTVKVLNPRVVTVAEQEANHNTSNFLDRFMEAFHYYSSMFDSLEASDYASNSSEQMLAEMYLGREICNVVGCEGADRTERHEPLEQWRLRMGRAGFQQIYMGPNAFKQASMLLTLFSSQGYRVEDKQGCLTLCWHGRPLIAASAWHGV
ncbi:hypothetical protein R1sor_001456 [Riccia sorocarpa]|uniref:DELLA protein n=1 Tax=Riccia sorocarpa TaxID=122646 RepID=A0ABD3H1Y8_9MARC